LLREKRLKAEQDIANAPKQEKKGPSEDEVNQRKRRLQAIREQQLKKKNEERQKQLGEFNEKIENKNDLHSQLLELDKKTKAKTKIMEVVGEGEDHIQEESEVDRRLELMRKMRKEIDDDERKKKEAEEVQKQIELNKRIKKLEEIKKQKEQEQLAKEQQEKQGRDNAKGAAFLSGIQTFDVEDI
jgi:hypothetical protein